MAVTTGGFGSPQTTLADHIGWFKVGLEAFTAHGPALVEELTGFGPRVFLDLKLHDIPATVGRAAANCAACGASMLTVHAAGGRRMLEAAVEGARQGAKARSTKDRGGHGPHQSRSCGALRTRDRKKRQRTWSAHGPRWLPNSGLDGVVASAREAAALRREFGEDFLIVTPGIRPASSATDDQRRVVTPAEAIRAGADILVVGRPITGAEDILEAAKKILGEMASADS